jgi:hypothetical protein
MAKVFMYNKKIYSVSDRNAIGEFLVVKMSFDKETVEDVRLVPALNEQQCEKFVKTNPFYLFKKLPYNPIQ